ncbi:MAG: hypothetical protein ACI9V8_002002 [Urechidicola sp.]|jgi:hypothetical protein
MEKLNIRHSEQRFLLNQNPAVSTSRWIPGQAPYNNSTLTGKQ